jgi:hypothetical protein
MHEVGVVDQKVEQLRRDALAELTLQLRLFPALANGT